MDKFCRLAVLKDKVLGAHRFGLDTIILPKLNETDLEDLPDEVRESMKFYFAETVDDVLEKCFR